MNIVELLPTNLMLAILFRPFGFIAPKTLNYLAFQMVILETRALNLLQFQGKCTSVLAF
jgi:hypothetical protein